MGKHLLLEATAREKEFSESIDNFDNFYNIVTRNNIVWKIARNYSLC